MYKILETMFSSNWIIWLKLLKKIKNCRPDDYDFNLIDEDELLQRLFSKK